VAWGYALVMKRHEVENYSGCDDGLEILESSLTLAHLAEDHM
jgi:hypothetical protein